MAATLTDTQLSELLPLINESDTVELKLTVPPEDLRPAVRSLGLDPLDAQIRQVFFFDTPDLTLNDAGVVVRARRVQGKGDDTVVKLRPVIPHELDLKLRAEPGFGVEVDAMPGGFVCSGSLKGTAAADVRTTVQEGAPDPQALHQAAAALLCRTGAEGRRAGRPRDPRPDLRAEAQAPAGGLQPQARHRALALPRRLAGARALDEVRARRRVPRRGRGARLLQRARHRHDRRAADQDAQGAGLTSRRAWEDRRSRDRVRRRRPRSRAAPGRTPAAARPTPRRARRPRPRGGG